MSDEKQLAKQPKIIAEHARLLLEALGVENTPERFALAHASLSRIYVQGWEDRETEYDSEHMIKIFADWTFDALVHGIKAYPHVPEVFIAGVIAGFSRSLVFIATHEGCSEDKRSAANEILELFEVDLKDKETENDNAE